MIELANKYRTVLLAFLVCILPITGACAPQPATVYDPRLLPGQVMEFMPGSGYYQIATYFEGAKAIGNGRNILAWWPVDGMRAVRAMAYVNLEKVNNPDYWKNLRVIIVNQNDGRELVKHLTDRGWKTVEKNNPYMWSIANQAAYFASLLQVTELGVTGVIFNINPFYDIISTDDGDL